MSTPGSSVRPRAMLIGGIATVLSLGAVSLAGPSQAATLKAPGNASVSDQNSSTPILGWSRVPNAGSYQVQIDNDSGFGSPEVSVTTVNSRYVPVKALPVGQNYWRVRATSGSATSDWTNSTMQTSAVTQPVPLQPADGASLAQPTNPPLLRWEGAQGATSYTVEVDGDSDLIGAKTYTTQSTSLVVADPLIAGDYYWRVTASKGSGIVSPPSATYRFDILPLSIPTRVYPPDNIDFPIEDVVLDWDPVAGAKTYDLQVALDADFANFALDVKNVYGTRYSPAVTLNNDQFWWRVRAVDANGQQTAWSASQFNFKRQWPDKPTLVYPTSALAMDAPQYFQWTPAQHATRYQLQIDTDANFNPAIDTCETELTTYTPWAQNSDCEFPVGPTVYWRVRAIDDPYSPGGLPASSWSDTATFTYDGASPTAPFTGFAQVTGTKVAVTGQGIVDPAKGCTGSACPGLPATPVLSWDRMPGINGYQVWFAQDENFTTTEVQPIYTTNTFLALGWYDQKSALPESQAGMPYYWYVVPCRSSVDCALSPASQFPPLPGVKSFGKASPPITGLSSSDPAGSDITFTWQDYHDTNAGSATLYYGERGIQTARSYRIQVDDNPTFSGSLIDDATVDQATYTAPGKLYPEGALYWRVRAIDGETNPLAWSATQSLIKSTPQVPLVAPVGATSIPGTTTFRWQPQAFAATYTLEVFKNNDTTFSPANRVVGVTVKNAAYTPDKPIPASSTNYVWRVRRTDTSGNPGPWSATGSFVSLGTAPGLRSPNMGTLQPADGLLFDWNEVPSAATYQLAIRESTGSTTTQKTTATAFAPTSALKTGSYTWTVTALDSNGQALGTSNTRTFTVDATAPEVTKIKPKKIKPKSVFKITFSEPVKGVTKKSVELFVEGKKKPLKAKVKLDKSGKTATLDPKKKLKAGSYSIAFSNAITDLAGNRLVATKRVVR